MSALPFIIPAKDLPAALLGVKPIPAFPTGVIAPRPKLAPPAPSALVVPGIFVKELPSRPEPPSPLTSRLNNGLDEDVALISSAFGPPLDELGL